jgi:NADH-quinone oxidoreductase subunit L
LIVPAELTISLPAWAYATLPLWPLLGAVLVGLMLMTKPRPTPAASEHEHPGDDHAGGHGGHAHQPYRAAPGSYWPVVLGVAASAVLALLLAADLNRAMHPQDTGASAASHAGAAEHPRSEQRTLTGFTYSVFRWISLGSDSSRRGHWIEVNYLFDGLTGVMLIVVTFVSLMVVIYSIGYMRDHHGHPERGYERFFAFLGLFVFSMLMLVLAGNFVLLYLGWELVGLCSYLLIGFYYPRPSAAAAAKKAFIVNRIGDFGFALGIFALYRFISPLAAPGENPLDYMTVFHYAGRLEQWQVTLASLLLLCGAIGKSAQFPLYVWLPDAMEGPSPVSALIHAATMVTAGIYMVARCGPLFAASQVTLDVVVVLGVIGALLSATMAMAQYDMKRILAYSTISQLAYMFVALGCAAPDSAIFHLYTHAFFKALLFLTAGSVMHAMGGVIDVRRFSGLRSVLPQTYWLMLIGCLALAGFPLLAGFWSKDEIVHAAFAYHPLVGVLMLVCAALTAYYTFRMFYLCFHGPLRLPRDAGEHPHDSPAVMNGPLVPLALGAVLAGYAGVTFGGTFQNAFLGVFQPHGFFHHYVGASTIVRPEHHAGSATLFYVSALIALGGIGLAWMRYGRAPTADPDAAALGGVWRLWNAKYYVDELYDAVFVRPLRRVGRAFVATDDYGIDGILWFIAGVPRALGAVLRFMQQGALQGYALSMVIGVGLLLLLWSWVGAG